MASEARREPTPPPAYFLSLTVRNVRCFGDEAQTLELTDHEGRPARWTVLLGDNGVGKTTLLECLAQLQPVPVEDPSLGPPANRGSRRAVTRMMHMGNGSMTWQRYVRESAKQPPLTMLSAIAEVSSRVRLGTKLSEHGGTVSDELCTATKAWNGVTAPHHEVDYSQFGGLVCYGYGAARRPGVPRLSRNGPDDTCASLLFDEAPLRSAEEWLLRADYKALSEAADRGDGGTRQPLSVRDTIVRMLVELLPDVQEVRFRDIGETASEFVCEARTSDGWVPLSALSLGYRTMIAWTVDLASRLFERYPGREDPLAEPAIVLLDEIDLHLHPKWQRSLMQFLTQRFRETQFIVTAHSPLVVQAAEGANIAVLSRKGDHVKIEKGLKAARGWRVDQVLTSDLFGLESARPPREAQLLAERAKLASKSTLTEAEKARLEELEGQLADLPTGETREDREAMDIIRRAAAELKQRGAGHNDPHP